MDKFLYLLLFVLITSCYSTKKVTYLQTEENTLEITNIPINYLVQPNDILNIRVQSLDPEQSAFFNISAKEGNNIQANEASLFLSGYSVSQEGLIDLPIVGNIKVSGLQVDQIQRLIQNEINKYLLDAIVLVKLTSYKISVLGDVGNPGTNYVYNTQATIFEALSAAGDANISANISEVKLIRQLDGKSYVIKMDLTNPKIIESPYYFLLPNDVIYVQTSKENIFRENLPLITTFFALISTTLLLVNFFQNQNN